MTAHKMVAAAAGLAEVKTGGNGMKLQESKQWTSMLAENY